VNYNKNVMEKYISFKDSQTQKKKKKKKIYKLFILKFYNMGL
jgi:hypothetical protein